MWRDRIMTEAEIIHPFPRDGKGLVATFNEEFGSYIEEPTIHTIDDIIRRAPKSISGLSEVKTETKLEVISHLGKLWSNPGYHRRLELLEILPETSGYHKNTVDLDLTFMTQALDKDYLSKTLDTSLAPAPKEALDDFFELSNGEELMALPRGPNFIIGAGNMTTPVAYSLMMSILTNNLTILKPSAGNFRALTELMESFKDLKPKNEAERNAIQAILDSTNVMYMGHDNEAYDYLLREAGIGVVNFWGGGKPLKIIRDKISQNPNGNIGLIVNGPMTGVAVIDGASVSDEESMGKAAYDLASNIVLFDQKLCNSPTEAYFIGPMEQAIKFAEMTGEKVSGLGSQFPCNLQEGQATITQQIRRELVRMGNQIYLPEDKNPGWTIVLSEGDSRLDDTGISDHLSIYTRPRFIEIITVPSEEEVIEHIRTLPQRGCFQGIERVQTVGYVMKDPTILKKRLALENGVYRTVPLETALIRTPLEPLDGKFLAREFVSVHYSR